MTNRYAHLREPQAVLDFHEHGRIDGRTVKHETVRFVRDSARDGLDRVRIVTGRGRHSAHGPKVRPQVERTLRELEAEGWVASYTAERVDRGGKGAWFVRLARPRA